ncbi:MAG: hypothetical protein EBR82_26925 [Caulobacteraceae bacterium]|nr:hypothetical protein [Caulobacteraceae bacterium]
MSKPAPTAEDPGEHSDEFQGPLGLLMRAAGEVMASRLKADAKGLDALSDEEMLDMFYSAVRQAAPAIYPQIPQHRIEAMLDQIFADARMDMAATAASTEAVN